MTAAPPTANLSDSLPAILALYNDGRCLEAWEIAQRFGPVDQWPGIDARILGARLLRHLGAQRLAVLIHLRAFRADPSHSVAQYYYLYRVHERRGALRAWRERQRFGAPVSDDPELLGDYHGQCAQLLGALRDFDRAEEHLARSREVVPERPYWYVERSGLFTLRDRFDEALAAAREGLTRHPHYPPLITSTADCLQMLGRGEDARELLQSASRTTQSSFVVAQLIHLLTQQRRHDEIPDAVTRFEQLAPLREKALDEWLTSTRAEVEQWRGDYAAALSHIERLDNPFHRRIGENLRTYLASGSGEQPRRVELPVPFVRQHHMTCAPATLTAISQFWNRPAEHLAVAEEICYDGTPDYSERNWADSNGWKTKEFRVDWPTARALIDRGIPFTLTTSDVASGHLQAAIGYDEPTRVLLVRDPTVHSTIEINVQDYLEHQASTGPRGMAMVPVERSALLDGVHLPDAEPYDLFYALQLALDRHDRPAAAECQRQLTARYPSHRLTHTARRTLAVYDANIREDLAATDALLQLFPNDQRLEINRLKCMRQISTRGERLEWLEARAADPQSDALLWLEYAEELRADDRRASDASYQVRRALRRRPDNPDAIRLLADLEWQAGRRADATELYRFAACLGPTREDLAQVYFQACRWVRQSETGFAFLRDRAERMGAQSGSPAMTLVGALEDLDRGDEAFVVLENAIERRPDDGALRLFAATKYSQYGRADGARFHLEAARGRVKHTAWLAEAAREARLQGERDQALGFWREILEVNPLELEAHRTVSTLLSEMSMRSAAGEHLEAYCARFPHHTGLHRLLYFSSAAEPAATREAILRRMIAIDPAEAWTMRELALNLAQQARFAEALGAAREAIALDRAGPIGYSIEAHVLKLDGRAGEAATCYREAILRSATTTDAIHGLLDVCGDTVDERKAALQFVQEQLEAQPVVGDGVLAFRAVARGVFTPDELLGALRRLHEQRPDLWQAGSAIVRHMTEMGGAQLDGALAIARGATERFATVAEVWLDLSHVHRARLEPEDEIVALSRCRELNPDWSEPIVRMADALERAGRPQETRQLFESAIKRAPLAPELRVRLALLLHRAGDTAGAIDTVRQAITIRPDFDWAWQVLTDWSLERGTIEETLNFARSMAEARPREVQAWLRLCDLCLRAQRPVDALAAADRAIEMSPRHAPAHDARAIVLTDLRRFRDAEEACHPESLAGRLPVELEGRAAWVDAQRGDVTRAIERMQALVTRSPEYAWGWGQLVEWLASKEQLAAAADAARRWAWLNPSYIVPLGWLGDIELRAGHRAAAKEVFQRALRLEPDYLFGGKRLFAIQKDERDYAGAARTLEIIRPYMTPDDAQVAQLELDAAQGNYREVLDRVRDLCRNPATPGNALSNAIDAVNVKDWQRALESTLRDVLDEPTWNADTPWLWARVRIRRNRLGRWSDYRRLVALGEPGKRGMAELLTAVGNRAREAPRTLARRIRVDWHLALIWFCCRHWRSDDQLWGKMGFALVCRGRLRLVARWMGDWRQRSGAESWMLQNLVIALFSLRRDQEGLEVLRRVVSAFSTNIDIGYRLRLWCALGAGLEGDLATADRLLHETPTAAVPSAERTLRELAVTLLDVLRAPVRTKLSAGQRAAIDASARADLRGASGRIGALARYRIARHSGDRWQQLLVWRELHPRVSYAVGMALVLVFLRLIASIG